MYLFLLFFQEKSDIIVIQSRFFYPFIIEQMDFVPITRFVLTYQGRKEATYDR